MVKNINHSNDYTGLRPVWLHLEPVREGRCAIKKLLYAAKRSIIADFGFSRKSGVLYQVQGVLPLHM